MGAIEKPKNSKAPHRQMTMQEMEKAIKLLTESLILHTDALMRITEELNSLRQD